jgi:predicted metal-dependent phosphotriesterase family hydrolase
MNVNYIEPEDKDYMRARNLKKSSDASKMALVIKDMVKLVRRTKAVIEVWGGQAYGSDMIDPFIQALKRNGFTPDEINDITRGVTRKQVSPIKNTERREVAPLSDLKNRVKDLL